MKVYKVVCINKGKDERFDDNSFISLIYSNFRVQYAINKKTTPIIGKLFVFKKINDAFNYVAESPYSETYVIFEGEAENCSKIFTRSCDYEEFAEFWKAKKQHKKNKTRKTYTPAGSYACESFKPLNIIWKATS